MNQEDLEENIIRFYREIAPSYERKYDNSSMRYMRAIERATIRQYILRRKQGIIDLGCGTGVHMIYLAREGHDILGVDLSEDMLSIARRNAINAGVESNIETLRANMESLPLSHARFNMAISLFGVLNHVLSLSGALKAISSLLTADGTLIFSVANFQSRYSTGSSVSGAERSPPHGEWRKLRMQETDEKLWTRFYTRQEVEVAIRAAGLQLVRVGGIFCFSKPVYRHSESADVGTKARMRVDRALMWRRPVNEHGAYLLFVCKKTIQRYSAGA
jgi:ubiquinone/menaquinone biosynthesis C-methylase UbiE